MECLGWKGSEIKLRNGSELVLAPSSQGFSILIAHSKTELGW